MTDVGRIEFGPGDKDARILALGAELRRATQESMRRCACEFEEFSHDPDDPRKGKLISACGYHQALEAEVAAWREVGPLLERRMAQVRNSCDFCGECLSWHWMPDKVLVEGHAPDCKLATLLGRKT